MKKAVVSAVSAVSVVFVVFVVLAMVVFGSCSAQSAGNDVQRIVGKWTESEESMDFLNGPGQVWVFNANGTGTVEGENFFYGISANGEIAITNEGVLKLFMSPDGRRMFWTYPNEDEAGIMFQKK